jgi:hypothetical protein
MTFRQGNARETGVAKREACLLAQDNEASLSNERNDSESNQVHSMIGRGEDGTRGQVVERSTPT